MIWVAWLVCLIGWPVVAFIPDKYESNARIVVDTESMLRPLLRGLTVETNKLQQIEIMHRTLLSRPNLEKVIRMTDLDIGAVTEAETEKLIQRLQSNVTVTAQRTNLFLIAYSDPIPEVAYKVVQALISIFVEGNLGTSRKELDSARQFIDEQVRIYEEQMTTAEQRLSRFKQANIDLLPGSSNYYDFLTAARSELTKLKENLADADTRVSEIQRQLGGVPEYIEFDDDSTGSGPPSGVASRLMELQHRMDDLLLKYTKNHPDVKATQRLVDDLKKELAEERASAATGGPGSGGPAITRRPNEVYQSIKMQLVSAQTEVASLRSKVSRQEGVNAKLEEQASMVPEVESELDRLTRDFELSRKNYEELLARQEAAIMSESQETKAEKVQFRIVEPPTLPVIPTGLKRSLVLTAVMVLGFGAGLGLVTLFVSLQTTFPSTLRLAQVTGRPVLGIVSVSVPKGTKTYRTVRIVTFVLAIWVLIAVYFGLMVVERNIGLVNVVPADVKAQLINKLPEGIRGRLE
ncbi:putative Lipopolysaccharide biosynthesis protein [Magnetospira sp. QH-2]|nr:putative Lipopolysaccharide biosynthesis protein [Magnetospira sp. QH-2]